MSVVNKFNVNNTPVTLNKDFINVNLENNHKTAYSSSTAARNAVPTGYRKAGLQITYLLADGWFVDQYVGSDINSWETDSNWNVTAQDALNELKANIMQETTRASTAEEDIKENISVNLGHITSVVNNFYKELSVTDNDKIIYATDKNGVRHFFCDVEFYGSLNVKGLFCTQNHPQFAKIIVNANDKIIEGFTKDGKKHIYHPIVFGNTLFEPFYHPLYSKVDCNKNGYIHHALKKDGTHYFSNLESPTINKINDKIDEIENTIQNQDTLIIGIGSSGIDCFGGEQMLTDSLKTKYGVSNRLRHLDVLKTMINKSKYYNYGRSGDSASAIFYFQGFAPYILKKTITLPKDGSTVPFVWDLEYVTPSMTLTPVSIRPDEGISETRCLINDIEVVINYSNSTIKLAEQNDHDIELREGSLINCIVDKKLSDCTILILQIGANKEGATVDEIINYHDLAIRKSNCKYFLVLSQNINRINSDLIPAENALKAKYGSNFCDTRAYMASIQALIDAGVNPTTSYEYPDINGTNSNPLNETQINKNIPCDMQCISEGRVPSSLWRASYRSEEGELQFSDENHYNALGYEVMGKFIYNHLISILKFNK